MYTLDDKFNAAVKLVRSLPEEGPVSVDVTDKLEFYSLFKRATAGVNPSTTPPALWRLEERLKWFAWNEKKDLQPDEAKYLYVRKIGEIMRDIHLSGKTTEYLEGADMSFLKKLDDNDIAALMEEAENHRDEGLVDGNDLFAVLEQLKGMYL